MTITESKRKALGDLNGNWGNAIIISLLYGIILYGLSSATGSIFLWVLGSVMLVGYQYCFIQGAMNQQYKIDFLFEGFRKEFGNRVVLSLVKQLFILLWSLLFIIPGIIKSYSYQLAEYISLQHPEFDYNECLSESIKKMDGHKLDMFIFDLSFLGWFILSILTCGIGFIFLEPYYQACKTRYIDANMMPLLENKVQI